MLLTAFLLTIFAYGLISRRAERTLLSAPLVVTAAGLGLGSILGQRGLGVDAADVLLVGELALAAMFFTSASAIRFRTLIGDRWLPLRLLAIADPLIVAFGAISAKLLLTPLSMIEACIVGTLLAPSAGSAVVERSSFVPPRVRRALGVESGLDGLAVPLLLLFIAMDQPQSGGALSWLPVFLRQVGGGLGAGVAIGGAGGWLIGRAWNRGWMSASFTPLALLALALMSWGVAESFLGANGFIASFVAGTLVSIGHGKAGEHLLDFTASWGQLLNLAVLFLFGGLMAPTLARVAAEAVLYALVSLTIVRMLPVAISMIGAGLHWSTVLFMGWFGPRG